MSSVETKDEFFEELQSLGVNFTDETVPAQMPVMESKPRPQAAEKLKGAPAKIEGTAIPKYAPNFFDRLRDCTKWAVTFGALTMLFFYWQETGLMDPVAAVPSMCVCTCLAGFGVGKNALK